MDNQNIIEKIKKLPQDLQNSMFSDEVSKIILDVGKKYGLPIDKIGNLGDTTTSVMLGEIKPSEFIGKLMEELKVEKEKAREIAEDINEQVFRPVRESLKKVHGLAPNAPEKKPQFIEVAPFAKKITVPEPFVVESEIKQSPPIPKKVIKFSQPPVNLPIEPTPNNLDANSLKLDIEKTLGGEIHSQSQPAKKYTSNDPYRESVGP